MGLVFLYNPPQIYFCGGFLSHKIVIDNYFMKKSFGILDLNSLPLQMVSVVNLVFVEAKLTLYIHSMKTR